MLGEERVQVATDVVVYHRHDSDSLLSIPCHYIILYSWGYAPDPLPTLT
jgi:hypothetical protein